MTARFVKKDKPVDWQRVREQLAAANCATEEALSPSASRAAAILESRARALARRKNAEAGNASLLVLVVFSLARERYAIEARFVREVLRLGTATPVPSAPDFLLGLTNLRGEILPVFDSRKLFGLEAKGLTDLSRLIVLGEHEADFAILADRVEDVIELAETAIERPPHGETGRAYVRGVTKDALVLLDGAALLADASLFIGRAETPGLPSRNAQ